MSNWLVMGISGVTNGGKTTLAKKLHSLYPNSRYLCMDDFFLPIDDPRHSKVPGLDHNNWDCLQSIDIEKWTGAVQAVISSAAPAEDMEAVAQANLGDFGENGAVPQLQRGLLILDGFLALNEAWTAEHCHLKFYLTLTKEQCWQRRQQRCYVPPDIPGYFDACVWPEHKAKKAEAIKANPNIVLVDGSRPREEALELMLQHIVAKQL